MNKLSYTLKYVLIVGVSKTFIDTETTYNKYTSYYFI